MVKTLQWRAARQYRASSGSEGPGLQRRHSSAEATFHIRLNKALDERGFPAKDQGRARRLAADLNVTPAAAARWVSGEAIPERFRVEEIARRYDIGLSYLEVGHDPATEVDLQLLEACIIGASEGLELELPNKLLHKLARVYAEAYEIAASTRSPPREARSMAYVVGLKSQD